MGRNGKSAKDIVIIFGTAVREGYHSGRIRDDARRSMPEGTAMNSLKVLA
jgi:hypothetical protein